MCIQSQAKVSNEEREHDLSLSASVIERTFGYTETCTHYWLFPFGVIATACNQDHAGDKN